MAIDRKSDKKRNAVLMMIRKVSLWAETGRLSMKMLSRMWHSCEKVKRAGKPCLNNEAPFDRGCETGCDGSDRLNDASFGLGTTKPDLERMTVC